MSMVTLYYRVQCKEQKLTIQERVSCLASLLVRVHVVVKALFELTIQERVSCLASLLVRVHVVVKALFELTIQERVSCLASLLVRVHVVVKALFYFTLVFCHHFPFTLISVADVGNATLAKWCNS